MYFQGREKETKREKRKEGVKKKGKKKDPHKRKINISESVANQNATTSEDNLCNHIV